METKTIIIEFDDCTPAEANVRINELIEIAKLNSLDANVKRTPKDPNNQDAGTILTIVLGAPAVVVLMRGIAKYLTLKLGGSLTLRDGSKEVIAKGVNSKTVERIATKVVAQWGKDSEKKIGKKTSTKKKGKSK